MTRRLPALALAGLLAGCASTPLWVAKSPDRRQSVRLLDASGGQRLLLDGRELGRHDGVAVSTFSFSSDGRQWAYAARQGKVWEVRSSLGASGNWDGIGELVLSPQGNRLAFSAERRGSWHAVVDFEAGSGFQELLKGAFLFSADGKRFAYAGLRAGKARVVTDKEMGPEFDGVAGLRLDSASRPLYAARRGDSAFLVRDGVPGPAFDAIGELAYHPATDRLAYAARRGQAWHVVLDGRPGSGSDAVRSLVFHPEGTSVAWVARNGGRDVVVQDGIQSERDYSRIVPGTLAFPPGAGKPAFVAMTDGKKMVFAQGGGEGQAFEEIAGPVFGEGGFSGYAGRGDSAWSVVVQGREVAREAWAGAPVFGAKGRFAYAARRPQGMCVVAGDSVHAFDVLLDDTLVFGPDGETWGCLAGARQDGKLWFIVNGRRWKPLDLGEVAGEALKGSVGKESPAREWVRAELALKARRALPGSSPGAGRK